MVANDYCGHCGRLLNTDELKAQNRCSVCCSHVLCLKCDEEQDPTMDVRDFQIIRHGATALNNEDNSVDRIRGWKDIPLSAEGRAEAKKLGRSMLNDKPDVIVSSDLCRAEETAKIISKIIGVPISEVTKDLRPWNVGKYAGMTSKDAIPLLEKHVRSPDTRCPGGESFNEFGDRFVNGIRRLMDQYSGRIAIVAHHRNERYLVSWAKKGFPADGSIDLKCFTQKGDAPGTIREMHIPEDVVEDFYRAERKRGGKKPARVKYPKEMTRYVSERG